MVMRLRENLRATKIVFPFVKISNDRIASGELMDFRTCGFSRVNIKL